MKRARLAFLIILVFTIIMGCSSQETRPIPQDGVYRSPTQVPTLSPTVKIPGDLNFDIQQDNEKGPTPTPQCLNNLLFLRDLTIPDGTVVKSGDLLDKRWEVKNNGSCNWNEGYSVRLIAGPGMGMPVKQTLFPGLSGTDLVIRMIFIAPDEPGYFRSAWQAYDPQDIPFGDPFFIDIVVPETVEGAEGE